MKIYLTRFPKKFRFCHERSSDIKSLKSIAVGYGHLVLSKLTYHLLFYQPVPSIENRNIILFHIKITRHHITLQTRRPDFVTMCLSINKCKQLKLITSTKQCPERLGPYGQEILCIL